MDDTGNTIGFLAVVLGVLALFGVCWAGYGHDRRIWVNVWPYVAFSLSVVAYALAGIEYDWRFTIGGFLLLGALHLLARFDAPKW